MITERQCLNNLVSN